MTPPIATTTTAAKAPTQREIDEAYEAFAALEDAPRLTLVPSHGGTRK